jgi:hypothetical protein
MLTERLLRPVVPTPLPASQAPLTFPQERRGFSFSAVCDDPDGSEGVRPSAESVGLMPPPRAVLVDDGRLRERSWRRSLSTIAASVLAARRDIPIAPAISQARQ